MDTLTLIGIYILLCLALGGWNKQKGHGFWLGFLYSIFLTPVVGSLTIGLSPAVTLVQTAQGTKRSCPHCFELTPLNLVFCESCGRHMTRQTVKDYLRLGELLVGLIMTIVVVRILMQQAPTKSKPTSLQKQEQVRGVIEAKNG